MLIMSPTAPRERQRRPKTSQDERQCSICSQTFKKAEHLARHIRSHTKERPFTCDVCGKFYVRQDTLLRHTRSHRVNAQPARQTSEGNNGSVAEWSPLDDTSDHQACMIQPSNAAQSASSAPEQEQMLLDLPLPPIPDLPAELTASKLDASVEDVPVQQSQSDQPTNDHGDAVMHWPFTEMNDILTSETSPWETLPDGLRELDWMPWLTGPNFDLDALNQSLIETTDIQTMDLVRNPDEAQGPIQRRWHTCSESIISSGQTTPDLRRPGSSDRDRGHIHMIPDESYRQTLAESLQQRVQPGILPSTGFLDFCLQAYFKHFQPIFPLIHVPTFRPSKKNALLLLSICSIGSLFLGSPRAVAHGISMFERLQKSILASWDAHIAGTGDSSINPLQASAIGQTFGLLVGRPKDLTGIEVFHGSIIAWARSAKLFKVVNEATKPFNIECSGEELEASWKAWARLEEKKRIVVGIYIHDVELAKLHNHEPILRHAIEKIPKLSPLGVFTAPNAVAWKKQHLLTQQPNLIPPSPPSTDPKSLLVETKPTNDFESYAILESIGSLALEDRGSAGMQHSATVEKCQRLLIQWFLQRQNHNTENAPPSSSTTADPFCLRILWHSTFMHLYTRFDDLECECGREGEMLSQQKSTYAASWAKSTNAKRALLHAALIQREFQTHALGAEPAIHVPMALYYAGLAWASFTQFGASEDAHIDRNAEHLDSPELRLLGINQMKFFAEVMGNIQMGRPASGPLFRAIDLLGKINHWKLSQNLSSTLLGFVENMPDLF
ncbi:hypothetical protein P170DRAFT_508237 [Aspergillus steynii IBT 23096]|uniref:C2H2-type domain-containing protein n=1 Tax=Aspergillus steynii IBT 23096 TaxID=1392250 RepID=A0A2I2GAS4_9EURO|nr:uncharacterized protein P170DRAFT_508237 [Aspergillus steynii IBT 23096]PLB49967.1 hypothetical protein P170DRAFT_508237 [Aspergillus steynii IBT 23096]